MATLNCIFGVDPVGSMITNDLFYCHCLETGSKLIETSFHRGTVTESYKQGFNIMFKLEGDCKFDTVSTDRIVPDVYLAF